MDDHDDGHAHGEDVHKVVCDLEDERVADLDGARVADGRDAGAAIDVLVADEGAQGERGRAANVLEVAEAHGDGDER